MKQYLDYPESKATKSWSEEDLIFSVVLHHELGHYCGYVRFPKKPVREEGYHGILTYVPVHGGITYAEQGKDGSMVYGFDCAHSGDWCSCHQMGHKWTLQEVREEIKKMAVSIQLIAKYERRYLRNITPKGKAKVIDEYHEELKKQNIAFDLQDNFGAMLNLLAGQI